jgi:hypothetical protein
MIIQEGFSTIVTCDDFPGWTIIMRDVTPPPVQGGVIDTTNMLNRLRRTKVPRWLYDVGEFSTQCLYDPAFYTLAWVSLVNYNRPYNIIFPDNSRMRVRASMTDFAPQALRENELPLADVKFMPLGRDTSGGEVVETLTVSPYGVGTLSWPPTPRPVGIR